jgi:hypothetical protein
MEYYHLRHATIHHEPERYNGRYYARVVIDVMAPKMSFDSEPKLRRIEDLEVILNGPGMNKAVKKINSQLLARGITRNVSKYDITPLFSAEEEAIQRLADK